MIDLHGIISVALLKKTAFTGSCENKLRYRLSKTTVNETDKLEAVYWKRDCCFDVTREEERTSEYFELTKEGIEAAAAWLNEVAESVI